MQTLKTHFEVTLNGQTVLQMGKLTSNSGLATYDEDTAVPANATTQVVLPFPVANIKQLVIFSEIGCTIKTNSSGSPANTIVLTGGAPPIVWTNDKPEVCPLTTDVTSIYFVVGAGVTTCKPKIYVVYDASPGF